MSLNLIPLKTVSVLDPRLSYNNERVYTTLKGGQIINSMVFAAQTPISNTVTVNCTLPSRNTAVSRKAWISMSMKSVVTGTNTVTGPTVKLLNDGAVAPRQFPIHSAINNATIRVGDSAVTQSNVNTYVNPMSWYKQRIYDEDQQELSTAPAVPDQSIYYEDLFGANKNPLGVYGDSSLLDTTRGGFSGMLIDPQTAGNVTANVVVNSTEELMISPFAWGRGSDDEWAFIGIEQLNFSLSLDLSRCLSIMKNQARADTLINITSVVTTIQSCSIILQVITPSLQIPRPMKVNYPYSNVVRYSTTGPLWSSTSLSAGVTMNNIQLNSIPRLMFIYASRQDGSRTSFQTDASFIVDGANGTPLTFDTVPPLSMQFNNRPGLFSTTTAQQLYDMSRRNGLQMSWTQWSKTQGSVICIDVGAGDLGLDVLESVGLSGNYNMQFTIKLANPFLNTTLDPVNIPSVLNLICVYDGVFNIVDGATSTNMAVLTAADVAAAKDQDTVGLFEKSISINGGSFVTRRHNMDMDSHKMTGKGLIQYSGGQYGGLPLNVNVKEKILN